MYFSALTIFWVLSSVGIFLTHILLSQTTNPSAKSREGSLLKCVWRLFMFGKLKQDGERKESRQSNVAARQEHTAGVAKCGGFSLASSIPKSYGPVWFSVFVRPHVAFVIDWFFVRFFSHFYLVGVIVHSTIFSIFIYVLLGNTPPYILRQAISVINFGKDETGSDSNAWPVVIVFTMELLQMLRRLYECTCVSTFSKGTMSIIHYFYGIFLYSSFGLGLLASVPLDKLVFAYPGSVEVVCIFLALALFVWSSYYQHKSMQTFASLRKNKKDHQPDGHYIPQGHLFNMVSCPHYLCELLIYLALCLVFTFRNSYLLSVGAFVWTNQICVSLTVHTWYKQHFPAYPVTRKSVIPYLL